MIWLVAVIIISTVIALMVRAGRRKLTGVK